MYGSTVTSSADRELSTACRHAKLSGPLGSSRLYDLPPPKAYARYPEMEAPGASSRRTWAFLARYGGASQRVQGLETPGLAVLLKEAARVNMDHILRPVSLPFFIPYAQPPGTEGMSPQDLDLAVSHSHECGRDVGRGGQLHRRHGRAVRASRRRRSFWEASAAPCPHPSQYLSPPPRPHLTYPSPHPLSHAG